MADWVILLVFGAVMLGAVYLIVQATPGGWNINFNFTQGNQTTPPPGVIIINNTQTVYQTQLCDAFAPIIHELTDFYGIHPSVACAAGGGTWICDANHVGCYDYAPIVDCTTPVYALMITQCEAYHATGVCTDHQAYCEYM